MHWPGRDLFAQERGSQLPFGTILKVVTGLGDLEGREGAWPGPVG